MDSEKELISACKEGKPDAWDELFERHYASTGRFLYQMSPALTREDVDEICQEVFLAVVRNLASYMGASSLQTWIFRIAINKARDFITKQQAAKRGGGRQPISLDAEDPLTGQGRNALAPTPSPDGQLLNNERNFLIRQCMDEMGDPCRELIELRYFGDLSYEEIAAELKMNPKTVSSRLSKCLDKLDKIIRPLFKPEKTMPTSV